MAKLAGLVLSLFPGIGLLDRAFEEEGFCVVRGPDLLWGGDIHTFHPPAGKFDGVIGGPPCQAFSRLRHIVEANGHKVAPNRIPEFIRVVEECQPQWFLMENVPDAPVPAPRFYGIAEQLVDDVSVGGRTSRTRRFTFGRWDVVQPHFAVLIKALFPEDPYRAITCDAREVPVKVGGTGKVKTGGILPQTGKALALSAMCELQGLPSDFLADAPFTMSGKRKAVGNGVPLPMGRAVARAVKATI